MNGACLTPVGQACGLPSTGYGSVETTRDTPALQMLTGSRA